jgi:hypothetical protein
MKKRAVNIPPNANPRRSALAQHYATPSERAEPLWTPSPYRVASVAAQPALDLFDRAHQRSSR